jgi:hypothetical protein
MEYFIFPYRISVEDGYLVWVSDDEDSKMDHFVTDESEKIPSFSSLPDLKHFATLRGFVLTPSVRRPLDLDDITGWLSKTREMPDCHELLDAWNAFSDISASFEQNESVFAKLNFASKAIYDKLFWGSNLPAVTPAGQQYDPVWSESEIEVLTSIFIAGLDLFISSTRCRIQQPLQFPDLG